MAARVCSECSTSLAGKGPRAKTCGDKCRATRSRRLHRAREEEREYAATHTMAQEAMREAVRRESPDVINKVMRDELAPVVREAITEDTLRAIRSLIGLTPRAVKLIEEDLESKDPVIRQRAYTLLMKYTVGHPSLVQPKDTGDNRQINVTFELPRPEAVPIDMDGASDTELPHPVELRQCDLCNEFKREEEFVAPLPAERCKTCFTETKARILAEYAGK